ncbi:LysM peptidoglycan-binding domain-containing protein [Paracoccus marcusii]|nr:LysM peptidoglycan-binding domain-containing protein [Paracoccus marcusii]
MARRYDVSVQDLASWNGLPADMSLRTGQRLLVPQPGQKPDRLATTAPGAGARPRPRHRPRVPCPPRRPHPREPRPRHAPDRPGIHADRGIGRRPVPHAGPGSIIRVYERARTTASTSRPRAAQRSPRQAAARWPRSPATARARRSSWFATRAI